MVKLAIVRYEHDIDFTNDLNQALQTYKRSDVLFRKEDIAFIEELEKMHKDFKEERLDSDKYYFYLKNKLVNLEHTYEYYGLEWRLSFILRIAK